MHQKENAYLGLDVGAASMVLVLIDRHANILDARYWLVHKEGPQTEHEPRPRCIRSCASCLNPCGAALIVRRTGEFLANAVRKFDVALGGFVATGSQVTKDIPFPVPLDMVVSEIGAHARGMRRASNTGGVHAIIDVGGQDIKVIRLANPLDFHMSGLCAAGTGTYLDEISRVERISVSDFGNIGGQYICKVLDSLDTDRPLSIEEFSSTCTVFTKSSYVRKKGSLSLDERVAAICWAQAKQVYNTVIPSLRNYEERISLQGGVSFNFGVRLALDHFLKKGRGLDRNGAPVLVIPEISDYCDRDGKPRPVSHLMGALGAALLGKEYADLGKPALSQEKHCPPLRGSKLRKNLLREQIRTASRTDSSKPKVAWNGTLFPSEICYLFDIVPVPLPVLAAIDCENAQHNLLTASREEGVDRANCTILSAVLGRLDRTPAPDFIFHTTGSCDYYRQHMLRVIDLAVERFGLDPERQACSVDLPTYTFETEGGIRFLADQLRNAVYRIEETLKVRHDPAKLRGILQNVNRARHYHVLTEELRAKHPALAYGSELLKRAVLYSSAWGTEAFVEITKAYYEELAERARSLAPGRTPLFHLGEKHRILWVYLWDYTSTSMFTYLEGELNCAIVAEELNHIHWAPMDPDRPFESIARRVVQPINHLNSRITYLMEMAERYRVDGIILFAHFFGHCPLASESIQNLLRKSDYPTLFLEGDCLDETRRPSSTITKVQAFVEQLNLKSYGNLFGVRVPPPDLPRQAARSV
ncbi:MAG: 2-hydroxyacyl-CoA dehydratase [bacterium]